jgi:PHD-zinc-finger like domain
MPKKAIWTSAGAVAATGSRDEDTCAVCFDANTTAANVRVCCEDCGVSVHQACGTIYPVPEAPCDARQTDHTVPVTAELPCAVCPVRGGAFLPTTNQRWCHITCAMWTPSVSIATIQDATGATATHIDGVTSIPHSRAAMICLLCTKRGSCIQCCHLANAANKDDGACCGLPVHPMCGLMYGMRLFLEEMSPSTLPSVSSDSDVARIFYCPRHVDTTYDAKRWRQVVDKADYALRAQLARRALCSSGKKLKSI